MLINVIVIVCRLKGSSLTVSLLFVRMAWTVMIKYVLKKTKKKKETCDFRLWPMGPKKIFPCCFCVDLIMF